MKLHHYLIYAASLALAFCAGWAVEFWNTPLGEPFCVARGGDLLPRLIASMPQGYVMTWAIIFAAALLPVLALLAWIGASLHKMSRG